SAEVLHESVTHATAIKVNDSELPQACDMLGVTKGNTFESASRLREQCGVRLVSVTCGAKGSLLADAAGADRHPGYPVKVVDTIGAGDAFTAAMTWHLLQGDSLATINAQANRWGAWVASQAGAMPLGATAPR